MADQLSEGAILTLLNGGEVLNPILQVLGNRKLTGNANSDRYRLLVSDGLYCNSYAMLATQLNHMVESGQLVEFSIIRVNRLLVSTVNQQARGDKRVIILLDVTVVKHGSEVGFRIGKPEACDGGNASGMPAVNGGSHAAPTQPASAPQYRPPVMSPAVKNTGANRGGNAAPAAGLGDVVRTHPIQGLTPYQNRWVIKARVVAKTPIRTWSNARGEGKLFSMDLTDESGEIRATAFKDQCDKFYDMIEVGKVYFFSKGQLKVANKKFTTIKNDYEISFTSETQVVPCTTEDDTIPGLQFDFVPLPKLTEAQVDSIVDIIGVCKSAGDVQTFTAKTTNRELKKREITLVDYTNTAVTVTMWGTQAEDFDASSQPVVAIKSGRISEFNSSKSVSLLGTSTVQINPDIDEAHKLRGWFDNFCHEPNVTFNNISGRQAGDGGASGKWILLKEAQEAQLGGGDKPDYFTSLATVMHIRANNPVYKACPTENCNKKVIDQNNQYYRCEKCNREFDTFKWRYLLSAQLVDWTGAQWISLFQDQAIEMLGIGPDEVGQKIESGGSATECFGNALFHDFLFRMRAKVEVYNDEPRMKITAMSCKKPDVKDHTRRMMASIKEMIGMNTSRSIS